ncbi:MAG: hypothetical protein JNK82_04675 [Myxococcaceae bacterium]|nr:hypothetical protein [Myxococcaceae bacterium]
MILLTLLVLNLDIAPREPTGCSTDSDCVITTFEGCCGSCCPPAPVALPRLIDEARRRRCAVVECTAKACPDVVCTKQEPVTAFRAVCERRQCVAVKTTAAPVCRAASDCRVDFTFDTNGCAQTPSAVPATTPRPPQPPPRPLSKKEGTKPQFGLSPGGPQAPGPCPPPPQARAVCASGRCVLSRQFEE